MKARGTSTVGVPGPFLFAPGHMARSIPTTEPARIVAGDSLQWDRTDLGADYPPATWTLRYTLVGPASVSFDAADGGDGTFEVRQTSDFTTGLPAGGYRLRAHVTDGTDRFTTFPNGTPICDQPITVEADPEGDAPGGTHAERMLAAVEAALEGRITKDVEQYTYDGVSLAKIPAETLHMLRVRYSREVASQRAGGLHIRSIPVRFM